MVKALTFRMLPPKHFSDGIVDNIPNPPSRLEKDVQIHVSVSRRVGWSTVAEISAVQSNMNVAGRAGMNVDLCLLSFGPPR